MTDRFREWAHFTVLALCLVGGSLMAHASEPESTGTVSSYFKDRFGVELGAQYSYNNTGARADSTTLGRGTTIDLEDGLNLDDNGYLPALHAHWRISKRWRFDFGYSRLHRDGVRTGGAAIQWGDRTFVANASLASEFNLDVLKFSAGYAFYRTDRAEVGISAGVAVSRYEASLAGNALGVGFATEKYAFPAPLPTVGVYGAYAISPKFLLRGRIDYFDIDVGVSGYDVGGRILDARASIEYELLRHLSVGAGYRYLDFQVRGEGSEFRGKLEYKLSGPYVFSRLSF